MTKAKTITLTVTIRESALKKMIKAAGYKIKSRAAFAERIKSQEFRETMEQDLVDTWEAVNDDGDGDLEGVVTCLFDDVVEYDENGY